MKRNLLAIAIPALLVAGAANASIEVWNKDGNKLNLNGRVYASNYLGDRGNEVDVQGDHSSARLGFTGETQITETLTGYGRAEWETNTGKRSTTETRYAFAGLNFGQLGSVDYGRNDGVIKKIASYTDVLPELGGNAAGSVILGGRTDAALTYRNNDFYGLVDGLSFAIQYADDRYENKSETDNKGVLKLSSEALREAYGIAADYSILDTGLTVGAGYAKTGGQEDVRVWTAGVKYDANNLYLAALYGNDNEKTTTNKIKSKYYEVVAQYGIDFEIGRLTPSLAYVLEKTEPAGTDKTKDAANFVEVGATYDFNKNLSAIVDYKINLLDEKDVGAKSKKANTKDTVALGLIYKF